MHLLESRIVKQILRLIHKCCFGLPLDVNTVMASERFVDTLLTSNLKPLLSN